MTRKPETPADHPAGKPSTPSSPVAGEGTPAGTGTFPVPAGPDVPAAVQDSAAVAGMGDPGAAIPEGRARPRGTSSTTDDHAAQRKEWQGALSALKKAQRQQRARPWSKRDPYRNAVPGGRKPPPGGDAA